MLVILTTSIISVGLITTGLHVQSTMVIGVGELKDAEKKIKYAEAYYDGAAVGLTTAFETPSFHAYFSAPGMRSGLLLMHLPIGKIKLCQLSVGHAQETAKFWRVHGCHTSRYRYAHLSTRASPKPCRSSHCSSTETR